MSTLFRRRPPSAVVRQASWFLLAVLCLAAPGCGGDPLQKAVVEAENKLRENDPAAAIRLCKVALQSQPDAPELLLVHAKALLQRENRDDVEQAIDDLKRVLELDEDNDVARYHLGRARLRRQDFAAAIRDFDSVLLHSPEHLPALLQRAESHLNLAHHQAAITDCDAALAIDGNSTEAFVLRGRARLASSAADLAEADFSQALALDSRCAEAYWFRGIARASQGREDEAKHDRNRAADLDRRFAMMNSNLRENLVDGLAPQNSRVRPISPINVDLER